MKKNSNIKKVKENYLGAIILAGGRSTRIGGNKDKSQMKLLGMRLIDRVYDNIISTELFFKEHVIIVGPKKKYSDFQRVVEDIYLEKGPLGGIFSGLQASVNHYNLVVGCDMPFIEKNMIKLMIDNIKKDDIIIPAYGNGLYEPLCAIYSKNCLKIMHNNIINGNLSVRSIFPFLKVREIKENDIKECDPDLYSFFNINFRNDFERAEELNYKKEHR